MKKIIILFLIIFIIIGILLFLSYSIAKGRAEEVAKRFPGNLSPLKSHLVLSIGNDFKPCWIFQAEYNDLLTGSTFDVYITLFGKVFKKPKFT